VTAPRPAPRPPALAPGNVLDVHARLRDAFRRPSPALARMMDNHAEISILYAEGGRRVRRYPRP
jgi:hypothetical protein